MAEEEHLLPLVLVSEHMDARTVETAQREKKSYQTNKRIGMDAARAHALWMTKAIDLRQRDLLLRMVTDGVTEPCLQGCTPAQCRLWYAHLDDPQGGGAAGKATCDVADVVLQRGRTIDMHKKIAHGLQKRRRCMRLNAYLRDWMDVTREPVVLEAVAWIWLDACGDLGGDAHNEYHGQAVSAAQAADDPSRLLRVVAGFKRQFEVRNLRPSVTVDTLALERGWWTRKSTARDDALVYARVDEVMGDHEWVNVAELKGGGAGVSLEAVRASLARLTQSERLVGVGEEQERGVTYPHIWQTSAEVRHLLATLSTERRGDPQEEDKPARIDLTDEQNAVRSRVLTGHALTLCCSPAGTGKTHTASTVAHDLAPDGVILCLAPTHKALSVLRTKIKVPSRMDPNTQRYVDGVVFMTVQRLACLDDAPRAILVIVDETSMLTMRNLKAVLTSYASRTETRLLFLGDDAQLPCIGRGLPIRDMQTLVPTLRLTQCMRTEGARLVALATAVRDRGNVLARVCEGEESKEVVVDDITGGTTPSIVESVLARVLCAARAVTEEDETNEDAPRVRAPWEAHYVQVITPQNKHVDAVNTAVQTALGTNAGGEDTAFSQCYPGDAVRFETNTDDYKRGDEGVLVRVNKASGKRPRAKKDNARPTSSRVATVRRHDGTTVEVTSPYDLRPAYASTVHKAQGSEYDTVILALFCDTNEVMMTREMVYTSVTRARHALHLVGHLPWLAHLVDAPRRTVFGFIAN